MAGIRGGKSTEEVGEKEKLLSAVNKSLASACENENWGLIVEAAEDYQRSKSSDACCIVCISINILSY